MILVIAFVVGLGFCLANNRVRPYALGLMGVGIGLTLLGMIFAIVPHRTAGVIEGREIAVNTFPAELQRIQAEHLTEAQRAQAEHLAEIVKNQRMAAQMADAIAQQTPGGEWLETYPDGMQIKQDYYGHRTLVRPADANPPLTHSFTSHGSHQTIVHSQVAATWWILVAPIALVLLVFLFLRNRREGSGRGNGLAITIASAAVLLLAGGFVSVRGYRMQQTIPTPVATKIASVNLLPGERTTASEDLFGDVQASVKASQPSVDSIEAMWNSLTGPVIKLDLDEPADSEARRELAAAARTILAASAPAADPFTQGWLVNAAKAILKAAPPEVATSQEQSLAEAMDDVIAQYPVRQETPANQPAIQSAKTAPAVNTTPPLKPDWVDAPPTRIGNTQRVVVTTDPYSTAEECVPDLHAKLLSEVRSRVGELAQAAAGGVYVQAVEPQWLDISPEYILAELCPQGVYIETLQMSVGPMKRAHALLEFTDAQDQILLAKWKSYARRESMAVVAVLAAGLGGCLSLAFGLLKVDTWTRGYYSKRLFIGVPAAIIAAGLMFSVMVGLFG